MFETTVGAARGGSDDAERLDAFTHVWTRDGSAFNADAGAARLLEAEVREYLATGRDRMIAGTMANGAPFRVLASFVVYWCAYTRETWEADGLVRRELEDAANPRRPWE